MSQRNIFRRYFYYHNIGCCVLAYRIYGITSGRLFREFSFVVAGSVLISSFAALTFTPMLATKMLVHREKQSWFYRKTEPFFEGMNRIYSRSLNAFLKKRFIAIPVSIITLILIGVLWNVIPAEMAFGGPFENNH